MLRRIINSGVLDGDQVWCYEQDWVIPKRTKVCGLLQYLKCSGWRYVVAQAVKQYLFLAVRYLDRLRNAEDSAYFPYYRCKHPSLSRRRFQGLRSRYAARHIRQLAPDIVLSLYSKEIIPPSILHIPRCGCFNVHPAPLPFYRGVSPTFWCLANGERIAGVSLHRVDKGIDTGTMVAQRRFRIDEGLRTEDGLYMKCAILGAELVVALLADRAQLTSVRHCAGRPALEEGSYFSLPTKEAVRRFLRRGYRFFEIREVLERRTVRQALGAQLARTCRGPEDGTGVTRAAGKARAGPHGM